MVKFFLKKIIKKLHFFYSYFFQKENVNFSVGQCNIIIFGVPTYQNIGDQAIALAELRYLSDFFPDAHIIEIFEENTIQSLYSVKKQLKENDIICIQGGGNLGTMYPYQESVRECVIENIPNHPIISFPVSIFFEKNKYRETNNIKNFYKKNENFRLIVRERASYNLAKTFLPSNVISLTPDIALYLLKNNINSTKSNKLSGKIENVICFFRNDNEKKISESFVKQVRKFLNRKYKKVSFSDTFSNLHIIDDPKTREKVVKEKINQIAKYDFVVTDRLHGVILSLLANRPCVVLKNDNPKIQSTINTWLANCPLIFYLDNMNIFELNEITNKISQLDQGFVELWLNNINLDSWYNQLHNSFFGRLDVN